MENIWFTFDKDFRKLRIFRNHSNVLKQYDSNNMNLRLTEHMHGLGLNLHQEIFRFHDENLLHILDQVHAFQPPVSPYLKMNTSDIQYLLGIDETSFRNETIYKHMHAAFKAHFCNLETILEIRNVLDRSDLSKILYYCGYDQLYADNEEHVSESEAKCFCIAEFSERNRKTFKWVIVKVSFSLFKSHIKYDF